MYSPFPKSSSVPGEGRIIVGLMPNDVPAVEKISYQYPLKLISPSVRADQKSVLVFLLSYGGGLVGGDQVNLGIEIRPKSKLSIATQGYTKIFEPASPETITSQKLNVEIQESGALCLLPDPVQPFEGSVYEQTQIFKLHGNASLILLDWVTQGRSARGENWDLLRWTGRNEVWMSSSTAGSKERLLMRDNVKLGSSPRAAHSMPLREMMHGNAVFGTLILCGPLTKPLGDFFLGEFAALPRLGGRDWRTAKEKEEEAEHSPHEKWRLQRHKEETKGKVLWSAANVRGCVIVKFGAATVEAGRHWIGSMLIQEASIEQEFGEDALMCVR